MTEPDLRLLTVKQPHAWAIARGRKDVENRTWKFPLDVPTTIAVHAGMKYDSKGLRTPQRDEPERGELVHGAVIGFVDVVGDHAATEACLDGRADWWPSCKRWGAPEHRHWLLRNAWALPQPIPAPGRLWLHRPTDQLRDALLEALRVRPGRT